MENYKGQQQNFMGSTGLQEAAKRVTEIVSISELSSYRKLTHMTVKETNRYTQQFLCGHGL
jgi:hypothetical protein